MRLFPWLEHLSPLGDDVESAIRVKLQGQLARLEHSMWTSTAPGKNERPGTTASRSP